MLLFLFKVTAFMIVPEGNWQVVTIHIIWLPTFELINEILTFIRKMPYS
jgi:hypothetical protein